MFASGPGSSAEIRGQPKGKQRLLTDGWMGQSSHLRVRKRDASSRFDKILWPEDAPRLTAGPSRSTEGSSGAVARSPNLQPSWRAQEEARGMLAQD